MGGEGTSTAAEPATGALPGALDALMHHGPPNGDPRRHAANNALARVLRALAAREKARGRAPFVDVVDDACHALLRRRLRMGRPRFLEARHPPPRTDAEATHYLARSLRNAQLEFLRRGDFSEPRARAAAPEPTSQGLADWPAADVDEARQLLREIVLPALGLRRDAHDATRAALDQLIAMRLAGGTPLEVARDAEGLPSDAPEDAEKRSRDRLHQRWSRALERVARWTRAEREELVASDDTTPARWEGLLLLESLVEELAPRGARLGARRGARRARRSGAREREPAPPSTSMRSPRPGATDSVPDAPAPSTRIP